MKDTFNSNFYITAAAIGPVLYLALTLQGSTFEGIMKQWENLGRNFPLPVNPAPRAMLFRLIGVVTIAVFATVIILFGAIAELLALLALYQQKASPGVGQFILFSMVGLLVIATAVPLYRFLTIYIGTSVDRVRTMREYGKVSKASATGSQDNGGKGEGTSEANPPRSS